MKIAIDLEGTLIAECGEFACERPHPLARRALRCGLRVGAKSLLQSLVKAGHTLTLYTSGNHSALTLRLWCLAAGLPVRRIITLRQCRKNARRKASLVAWPPVQGQDLILDDELRHVQAAQRLGVPGIQITNRERDWTARLASLTQRPTQPTTTPPTVNTIRQPLGSH
nr:hypothetical protein [Armatimonas sp.]